MEVLFCENFLCLLGFRLYFEVLEKKGQEWDRTCTTTACFVDISAVLQVIQDFLDDCGITHSTAFLEAEECFGVGSALPP